MLSLTAQAGKGADQALQLRHLTHSAFRHLEWPGLEPSSGKVRSSGVAKPDKAAGPATSSRLLSARLRFAPGFPESGQPQGQCHPAPGCVERKAPISGHLTFALPHACGLARPERLTESAYRSAGQGGSAQDIRRCRSTSSRSTKRSRRSSRWTRLRAPLLACLSEVLPGPVPCRHDAHYHHHRRSWLGQADRAQAPRWM